MMSHPWLGWHKGRLSLHQVCFKRGKPLESVALESNLEASLVLFTWRERGWEYSGFLGRVQVLFELAQPPIVDILSFRLSWRVNNMSRIFLVIANDWPTSAEILKFGVLDCDYPAIFVKLDKGIEFEIKILKGRILNLCYKIKKLPR